MHFLKQLWSNCKLAGFYMKISLAAELEYKASFLVWLIANPLQFFAGFLTLNVLITSFGGLGGWSAGEIAFFYGLGGISHGLSVILFSHTWGIGYQVTEGKFDTLLLRPRNVFFQFCFSDFNLIGVTDLIPALPVFCYGCTAVGFRWDLSSTATLIFVILCVTVLRGGIFTLIGSLGFFTYRSQRLIGLWLTISDKGIQYPLSIYPHTVQFLLTVMLPIGLLSFYPSSFFLGKELPVRLPGGIVLWLAGLALIFALLGYTLFRTGLRHYDSAGS